MATPVFAAIGGTGWLGGALVRAALDGGILCQDKTTVTSRSLKRDGFEAFPGLIVTADNRQAVQAAEVVLLTVRPADLAGITLDLSGKLVLSVMALIPMAELSDRFGARRIVRAMPNAAAARGLSYSPYLASQEATPEDIAFAERFLGASGLAERVASEAELDYLTGLTGSGPAFFAALAAAMERDAVSRGFPPDMARRAIGQLIRGAAPELGEAASMQALVDVFLGYDGTTAAGLRAATTLGLDAVVHAMLSAAEEKAARGL